MRETTDGFRIAQRDLELRGPGELLGTRQAGAMQMRIADLIRDAHLLPKVEQTAQLLQEKFPEKIEPLVNRWLANAIHYGHV
jgi:ATP-dependent DNA helicase RecG